MALSSPRPARQPNVRVGILLRLARRLFLILAGLLWRPVVRGAELVPTEGPVIIAPVHRSFADFSFAVFLTRRKLFFMAKAELWQHRLLGLFLDRVGAFPVQRDVADRESLRFAQRVLELGQVLVMFPEGTRQSGPAVEVVHEGPAFLAARTGALTVPVGIGGSDLSMPKGRLLPKPIRVTVVVGPPLPPPPVGERGRVSRRSLREASEELSRRIEEVYAEACRPYQGAGS